MEEYKNNGTQVQEEEGQNISLRDIFEFVWRLRWWIVGCAFVALVIAVFYVRMQTPVYERTSWIMLSRDDGSQAAGEMSVLAEMTGTRVRKKMDNELFILTSPTLMSKVVDQLELNTRYYAFRLPLGDQKARAFRWLLPNKQVEFYRNSPIELGISTDPLIPTAMLPDGLSLEIKTDKAVEHFAIRKLSINGAEYELEGQFNFGDTLSVGHLFVSLNTTELASLEPNRRYLVTWSSSFKAAQRLLKGITTAQQGDKKSYYANQCDVVKITMEDTVPQRACDVINALVIACNEESKSYNNIASINTIKFIDERLRDLSRELGNAESNVKDYQARHSVVSYDSQASASVSSDMNYQHQLTEVRLQKRILGMIDEYLAENEAGEYRVIPANIGVSDAGLNTIIGKYNDLVSERNRLIANSSETNPRVVSMTSSIEDGKQSIKLTVAQLLNVYSIREKELERTLAESKSRMSSMPAQQYEIQQLSRRVDIIEPLYQLLQQKREETQISMYVQTDTFRIIEPAFGSSTPVKTHPMQIYLIALILGCIIPPGIVFLRGMLRTKVESKKDVEDRINVPVLASLAHNADEEDRLLRRNDRDAFSESFRMLRSNLRYLPDTKIVQVTSSFPGEGKSYIASTWRYRFPIWTRRCSCWVWTSASRCCASSSRA